MIHLRALLCGLVLAVPTTPAFADTISTFTANGVFQSGAILGGTVVIDTTTGVITDIDLTSTLGTTVVEFLGPSSQVAILTDNLYEFASNDTTNDIFAALIEGTSIIDYAGGEFCSVGSPLECPAGNGAWWASSVENPDTGIVDSLESGSLALTPSSVTPEPTTLALFGTGLVGMCGAIRRRVRI
jgi:hypothetical protein